MATTQNVNLVTGYTGTAHVRSEDDALLNAFLAGQSNRIINLNETHTTSAININGDVLVNGRLIRTDGNIELTIPPQPSGYYAFDTIYACYQKNISGIESAYLEYCPGTPSTNEETARTNEGVPTQPAETSAWEKFKLYDIIWATNQTFVVEEASSSGSTVSVRLRIDDNSNGSGWDVDKTLEVPKIPLGNGYSLCVMKFEPHDETPSFSWGTGEIEVRIDFNFNTPLTSFVYSLQGACKHIYLHSEDYNYLLIDADYAGLLPRGFGEFTLWFIIGD